MIILNIYNYDVSSYELISVTSSAHSTIEEAKRAAVKHNWQIAWDNCDTDLTIEEYVDRYSWDDLDYLQYSNYGYEIIN